MRLSKRIMVTLAVIIATVQMTRAQEIFMAEESSAAVQLRTNGLYDLALCPNIGLEIQTDLGLAWQIDYVGAWWNNRDKHRYYSNYALQTELRYYLGNRKMEMPYHGHHIGAYYQMATYDFEFGGTGYQCNDLSNTKGYGVSYGYAIPLNRYFSVDLTVGVGLLQSRYNMYEPKGNAYAVKANKKLTFVGPTKLEVTVVWSINHKNNTK